MLTATIATLAILGVGLYLLMRHDKKQAHDRRESVAQQIQREEAARADDWAHKATEL